MLFLFEHQINHVEGHLFEKNCIYLQQQNNTTITENN